MMRQSKKLKRQGAILSRISSYPALKERGHLACNPFRNLVGESPRLLEPSDRNVAPPYFPTPTMKNFCRKLPLILAVLATLLVPAHAETASTDTAAITVDTRDGTKVRGRMVDGTPPVGPYLPLAGVAVSLGTANAVTGANGSFELVATLTNPTAFNATKTGFMTYTVSVSQPATGDVLDLGLVTMEPVSDKPIVETVALTNPNGVYLRDLPEAMRPALSRPTAGVKVNWNGNDTGSVEFWVEGKLVGTQTGAGPSYTLEIPIDTYFKPSANIQRLKIIAKAAPVPPATVVKESEPFLHDVFVVSLPYLVQNSLSYAAAGPGKLAVDIKLKSSEEKVTLPVLGAYGAKMEAGASFDYTFEDGSWELGLGLGTEAKQGKRGRRPKYPGFSYSGSKLYIGNREIEASFYGLAKGSAKSDPFEIKSVKTGVKMGFKGELTRYGLNDILLPGSSLVLGKFPETQAFLKNISIILWLKVNGDGSVTFEPVWPPDFREATLTTTAGVEAEYENDIPGTDIHVRLYGGGEGKLGFGVPEPYFREAGFKIYTGIEANVWVFDYDREWVWLEYGYTAPGARSVRAVQETGTGYVVEAAANRQADWKPMKRPWREQGEEVFLAAEPPMIALDQATPELDVYAGMEKTSSPGAVYRPVTRSILRIINNPAVPAQAELPLLQNVFPNSDPALAARGSDQMLLYVRDTGAANPVHFTEIAWTRFDGTSWSTPAALAADSQGEFSPKVAFDGAGNAVAVWQRIKDPALTSADIDDVTTKMEIVTAKWNAFAGTWSAVTALTNNGHLDHSTELAGPLTDGDLLLTWRENTADLLSGTVANPSRVLTRRWDSATSTWGAAQVLVDGLSGELSTSLSAAGNKAVFLLIRDLDNDRATEGDTELFHRVWNETTASWGVLTRYTNDALADRSAKVAVDATGQVYALWQRGTELVMDRNLAGTPSPVRADAATAGFSDFILTLAPGGNVVVLWPEMTDFGSDAHYRVFDPASGTWGLDTLLSEDSDLERSFSPAWDAMGNLVLAYNNVIVTKQNKTVTLEGGEIVEVTGVPQPGRVDLLLAKRALVKDLSISANGLTAEGTTYLPGDAITLKAKVKNSGNVAVQDVPVSFYDGDPAAGGTLIQSVTLPGWLKAADEAEAMVNWTIPQPAIARTVYVQVDPAGTVTESDETNNTLSLPLNGVDLQAQYISGSVLRDGSARVVVRVTSLSAPESPVTMLRLKTETGTTALAEVNVSQLSPGDSVEIPLELPAGSHPEGELAYRVTLDEEALTGDVDETNNEILFTLNLWIDGDNDNLPNEWEAANGLSDANAADALLDSDGDGFNNRQEYLAGTNPQNGASVLKIGEVAQRSIAAGGGMAISWASTAGRLYNLERTYDLTNWVVLSRNTTATPPLNTVIDPMPAPFGKAFYRLVLLESTDVYDYAPLTRSIAFQATKQETQSAIDAQISWDSLAGKTYAVERSIDLVNWQVIAENIPAFTPRNTYTDYAPLSQTKAFYRVLER